jgi:hypothetical protein
MARNKLITVKNMKYLLTKEEAFNWQATKTKVATIYWWKLAVELG